MYALYIDRDVAVNNNIESLKRMVRPGRSSRNTSDMDSVKKTDFILLILNDSELIGTVQGKDIQSILQRLKQVYPEAFEK